MSKRADLAQVLAAAEAAFLEATGLASVRGVPVADLDDIRARLLTACPELAFPAGALADLALAKLEASGLEAERSLLGRAAVEVLDAVTADRALDGYYWRLTVERDGVVPADFIDTLAAACAPTEAEGFGADREARFRHAMHVGIALEGYSCLPPNLWKVWRVLVAKQMLRAELRELFTGLPQLQRMQAARAHLSIVGKDGAPSDVLELLSDADREAVIAEEAGRV